MSHFQHLRKGCPINSVKVSDSTPEDMFYHHPSTTSLGTELLWVALKSLIGSPCVKD